MLPPPYGVLRRSLPLATYFFIQQRSNSYIYELLAQRNWTTGHIP
jgi:hypothetical protein